MLLPTFDHRFLENSYILCFMCIMFSTHSLIWSFGTYFKYVNGTVDALNNCKYVLKQETIHQQTPTETANSRACFKYSQSANATPVFTPSFFYKGWSNKEMMINFTMRT